MLVMVLVVVLIDVMVSVFILKLLRGFLICLCVIVCSVSGLYAVFCASWFAICSSVWSCRELFLFVIAVLVFSALRRRVLVL